MCLAFTARVDAHSVESLSNRRCNHNYLPNRCQMATISTSCLHSVFTISPNCSVLDAIFGGCGPGPNTLCNIRLAVFRFPLPSTLLFWPARSIYAPLVSKFACPVVSGVRYFWLSGDKLGLLYGSCGSAPWFSPPRAFFRAGIMPRPIVKPIVIADLNYWRHWLGTKVSASSREASSIIPRLRRQRWTRCPVCLAKITQTTPEGSEIYPKILRYSFLATSIRQHN
jgi:hypothetical protein